MPLMKNRPLATIVLFPQIVVFAEVLNPKTQRW